MSAIYRMLAENPVIAAVKDRDDLNEAFQSQAEGIFLLKGNICELEEILQKSRSAGKKLFVHIDLLEGIGKDYYALKYLKEKFEPDGIITTKTNLVKYSKEINLPVIQRLFMLDSLSLETGRKSIKAMEPDAVEIMPGLVFSIIRRISEIYKKPVIAGGLINDKADAFRCLDAGAMGISTSCKNLWSM